MKMEHHVIISVPIAAGAYIFTRNWYYAAMVFILGVLVDVDHIIDYVREEGRFDLKDLFVKSYKGDFKQFYCIFHAWEYIPLAWIAGSLFTNYTFSIIFTAAYLAHMLPDQFMNNTRPLGYFLSYRIIKKFAMKELFYSTGRWIPNDKAKKRGKAKR